MVLITGQSAREFRRGTAADLSGISELAGRFAEVEFIYPVHLNRRLQNRCGDY